jgi:SAM-dependent methyltransferase
MMSESPFRTEHFERIDESPDADFYMQPRLVVHIDEGAVAAAGEFYAGLLPPHGEILDLMSSWVSHLPTNFPVSGLVGLGMNEEELASNPRLSSYVVHDLNADPLLPFESERFDGAIVTVSIQYLTRPLEVFTEVRRVLRSGAPFIVTFSNRCFPTKAVQIWRSLDDRDHVRLVEAYFRYSGGWGAPQSVARIPDGPFTGDPLFGVYALKSDNSKHPGTD